MPTKNPPVRTNPRPAPSLSPQFSCEKRADVPGWQFVRILARGKWSTVHLARPADSAAAAPADYVIKMLRAPFETNEAVLRQFRCEAKVARRLSHPNLISALSVRVEKPPYYMVMPHLEGLTLAEYLQLVGPVATPTVCWIGRQLADALGQLHQAGWAHGDVKPDNIILAPNGHVTLVDLGFVRPLPDRVDEVRSVDPPSTLAGTPHYAAPECFGSLPQYSAASDIYSLGVTLFEARTGCLPFTAESPEQLATAHCNQAPPNARVHVPDLLPRVARLLKRILAKAPQRRPSTQQLIGWLMSLEIDTFADR